MPRMLLLAIAATLLTSLTAASAHAQYGTADNPVGPTVSPYLNLLQSGQFGTTNYQSLVRPLINQGNAINRQGNSLSRLQQQVNSGGGRGGSGGTGHTTFFMNYSHFYPQAR